MLMTERFSLRCVELKYVLGPDEVASFLGSLRTAMRNPEIRRDEWRITTVYLDRENGAFARTALNRPERRAEIRLREYFSPGGEALSPFVWVESKQRKGEAVRVRRFQCSRRLVGRLLAGELEEEQILDCQPRFVEPDRARRAAREVLRLAGPGPLVISGATTCLRTALEGGDPVGRLTLDREIRYHLDPPDLEGPEPLLEPESLGPTALEERVGIVEIKYRGAGPPAWCDGRLGLEGSRHYSKFLILSALAMSRPSA